MLSIICEADFKENDEFRSGTSSYQSLFHNEHLENVNSSDFFNDFVENLKSNIDLLQKNESLNLVKNMIKKFLEKNPSQLNDIISLCISCLQSFVHVNWLGPSPVATNIFTSMKKSDPRMKVFNLSQFFDEDVKKLKLFDVIR